MTRQTRQTRRPLRPRRYSDGHRRQYHSGNLFTMRFCSVTYQLFINNVLWLETRDCDKAFASFRAARESRKVWSRRPNIRLAFVSDVTLAA